MPLSFPLLDLCVFPSRSPMVNKRLAAAGLGAINRSATASIKQLSTSSLSISIRARLFVSGGRIVRRKSTPPFFANPCWWTMASSLFGKEPRKPGKGAGVVWYRWIWSMKSFNRRVKFGRVIICEIVQFEEEFFSFVMDINSSWLNRETSLSTKNSYLFETPNLSIEGTIDLGSTIGLPTASRSKINSHRSNFWSILARKRNRERSRKYPFLERIFTGPGDISLHSYLAEEEGTIPFRRGIYKGICIHIRIYIERERRSNRRKYTAGSRNSTGLSSTLQ